MSDSLDTPVAFLVFNRPDCTAKVFEEIRRARPKKLLVVADGPRPGRPDDETNCRAVRELIEKGVDWPCDVETAYAKENMGCRNRVSSGLTWVFERVEEAIVLEDDCLPSPTFFPYCEELLARFRTDSRIMAINGCNYGVKPVDQRYSYGFARTPHVWGWATWRRAWKHYDVEIKDWPEFRDRRLIYDTLPDAKVAECWEVAFDSTWKGAIDTWDYQWMFAILRQSGLTVSPSNNLIINVGFDGRATHTKDPLDPAGALHLESIEFPLRHDLNVVPATRHEMALLRRRFNPPLALRVRRKLERAFRRVAPR
jgi:hypothetical protein